MYSQLYNPCLFEQLPVFHDSVLRPAVSPCPMKQNVATATTDVKMTSTKTENGLTLTFTKPLPPHSYQKAIEYQFYELKQKIQPTYKVVTDFFGNQYYVDNQPTEQEILNQIDVDSIGTRLAKESFQDYSLELSHDGSKILVSSPRDHINEPLQFGSTISDFHVAGCGVINDTTAMLKITVVFESLQSLEAKYQRQEQEEEKRRLTAIKKAQRIAEAKQERLVRFEKTRRASIEEERLARFAEAKKLAAAVADFKAKQEHEKKVAFKKQLEEKKRREREAKLRQQYEHQQKLRLEHEAKIRLQQKQVQEKLRQEYEAEMRQELARQERQAKIREEQEARRREEYVKQQQEAKKQRQLQEQEAKKQRELQEQEAKRQRELQEQIEYQRRLVEEEKQMKEKKRQESLLAANNKNQQKNDNDVVSIKVRFDDNDASDNQGYESSSVESASESEIEDEVSHPSRRGSSPPVLEDVEDDEMNRYNQSLGKSPNGSSIIEDA